MCAGGRDVEAPGAGGVKRSGLAIALLVVGATSGCSTTESAVAILTQQAQCQATEWRLRRTGTVRDEHGIIIESNARPDLWDRANVLAAQLDAWRAQRPYVPPDVAREFEASGEWDRVWQIAADQNEAELLRMADQCAVFLTVPGDRQPRP